MSGKKFTKKDDARLAGIVSSVGGAAREKISTLPKGQQDVAWASVATAVACAAIHDAEDRAKVFGFIKDSVNMMMALMLSNEHATEEDFEAAVNEAIEKGRP